MRKKTVCWNENLHMGPNVTTHCITFSIITVLNSKVPEEVRIFLADSECEKN